MVVTRAVHGAGAELLRDCDAVFAVMLGHEAFLLTNDVVANLPHAVSKGACAQTRAGNVTTPRADPGPPPSRCAFRSPPRRPPPVASTVHPIVGTPYAVLDVAPSAIEGVCVRAQPCLRCLRTKGHVAHPARLCFPGFPRVLPRFPLFFSPRISMFSRAFLSPARPLLVLFSAFAAVAGDRERLRPLAPRTKRATSPVIRASAKQQQQRATKDQVIASLDDAEFETVMRRLSGAEPAPVGGSSVTFTTRYTLSAQNTQAAQYIYEYFVGLGYADVFYHEFRYSTSTTRNIVAVKRGTVYPDEVVVYGAHMDSTSGSANTLAPGCIDNGSGTGCKTLFQRARESKARRDGWGKGVGQGKMRRVVGGTG